MFGISPRRKLSRWMAQFIVCAACFILGKHFGSLNNDNDPSSAFSSQSRYRSDSSQHAFLVIMVISAPNNLIKRMAIRNSWLRDDLRSTDVKPFFVIGAGSLPEKLSSELNRENSQFGDMLLLPSVDEYSKLTEKVLEAFVRIDETWDFNYLLKADDDSFVRVANVLDELKNSNYVTGLYWGYFDGRAPVQRHGQWAETDYVLCDRYLPYALGGGYVLSANLVTYLANNADELKVFRSEDVSVGTWLAPLKNVHRVHDVRFDTQWTSRGCSNTHIVMHKVSPADMKAKHAKLVARQPMCDEEIVKRHAYQYNWDGPPSNCCKAVASSISSSDNHRRRPPPP